MNNSVSFWLCAVVTVVSALVSFGYSLAALSGSTGVARTNAMYAFTRSLALALAAVTVLFLGSPSWLQAVAVSMILVQAGDAAIGAMLKNRLKTVGPALTAVANLGVLLVLVVG